MATSHNIGTTMITTLLINGKKRGDVTKVLFEENGDIVAKVSYGIKKEFLGNLLSLKDWKTEKTRKGLANVNNIILNLEDGTIIEFRYCNKNSTESTERFLKQYMK